MVLPQPSHQLHMLDGPRVLGVLAQGVPCPDPASNQEIRTLPGVTPRAPQREAGPTPHPRQGATTGSALVDRAEEGQGPNEGRAEKKGPAQPLSP